MTISGGNRFEDFFANEKYVALKNGLYNYLLRKRAVEKTMETEHPEIVLETGSGISPVLTSPPERIIYSDLSFAALCRLRQLHGKGRYVVACGMNLPFKAGAFSHVISSEVLEHIPDDRRALRETARVTKQDGRIVVTFPHRRCYFGADDRLVDHQRRYELSEMISRLAEAGFEPVRVRKVLGPLEKITMLLAAWMIMRLPGAGVKAHPRQVSGPAHFWVGLFKRINRFYAFLARIDALVAPRSLAAVLLIVAVRRGEKGKNG